MATYQDHLANLTTADVVSANKAQDYLNGTMVEWAETYLDDNVTDWRKRKFKPIVVKFLQQVIYASALSYNEPPVREVLGSNGEVDENASELYRDILASGDFDNIMDQTDNYARLLKNAIVIAQPVEVVNGEDKVLFHALTRANCDVDYDHQAGKILSLMYTSGESYNGNQLYHYWTDEQFQDIEFNEVAGKVIHTEAHGYGVIPIATLWDTYKPMYSYWPSHEWDSLVIANEEYNQFLTEVRFASKFQMTPVLVTDASLPDGMVSAPDAVIEITKNAGEDVYFEYKNAGSASELDAFVSWFKDVLIGIAKEWSVSIDFSGDGSADSGFKLIVKEFRNIELRNRRIKAADTFENAMYQVMLKMSDALGYGLPQDSTLSVRFASTALPVNKAEDWLIAKEKIALGVMSLDEYWRIENPDITDEQIEEKKRIAGIGAALPDFTGVVDGEQ